MTGTVNTNLWAHQEVMVDQAYDTLSVVSTSADTSRRGHFWFADCGTGKTLATLKLVERLNARLALIITVKPAIEQVWVDDINEHTTGFVPVPLSKGTSKQKNDVMLETADLALYDNPDHMGYIVIVNYETARLLQLQKVKWDLVVADESHRLASYNSKQSVELAKKLAHVPRKLAMTGTAWADRMEQIYGQFRFLYPELRKRGYPACSLWGSFDNWRERYANYYSMDNIKIITGYKNQQELADTIAPYMTRIRKSDAIELPPITHIQRFCKMTGALKKAYKEMKTEMTTRVDVDLLLAEHQMTQRHRLRQLVRGWYKAWMDDTATRFENQSGFVATDLTMDIIEEIGDNPTVIFTSYKEDVQILKERLEAVGKTVKLLTAEVKEHVEFNEGEGDVLIANYTAGSTGIKLYRASYMICYTTANSRTEHLQAIDRIHRPRQVNPVTVYHITVKDSIDEAMYRMMIDKERRDISLQELTFENI